MLILKDRNFHIWNLGTLGTQPRSQFVIGFFETFLVDGKFKRTFQQVIIRKIWTFIVGVMVIRGILFI
jgi:hypothetical protein